jgi:mevalonate kinase
MTVGRAPGKIILFGEHAVVYGRPAIAVPLDMMQATAEVTEIPGAPAGRVRIEAPDIQASYWLHEGAQDDPLGRAVQLTLGELGGHGFPALRVSVSSEIPIASGLGSGAAVSIAIIRALTAHLAGQPFELDRQSALAFEVEKLHHGTPSGIDNAVVTYNRPVYFVQGRAPETFRIGRPFTLAIGVSDMPSPTATAVSMVRQNWLHDAERFETLFDSVADVVRRARDAIEHGHPDELGPLMDENQELLEEMGVSSVVLSELIEAARAAGALGAKLSGAGLGGNVIALVGETFRKRVLEALRSAGATLTLETEVRP